MSGLISYGAYVPYYRLSRAMIRGAWGRGTGKGERSVANFDEDSITMAASAGMDCIKGHALDGIDGLFFCSTTSPYVEKQCAAHLVWVLGLRRDVMTADFTNTLRAGTTGLKAAHDAVEAGRALQILVVAADCRLGTPSSEQELSFGDGASSFLVGKGKEIAIFNEFFSLVDQIQDVWRKPKDDFVLTGEGRWIIKEGYVRMMNEMIKGLLSKSQMDTEMINRAALSAPDPRSLNTLARNVGLDMESQIENPLLNEVGNTGTAQPLMTLVSALEKAQPGDKIMVGAYGDGADGMLFEVTEAINGMRDRPGIRFYLESGRSLESYEKYLTFKQLVDRGTQSSFRG
ncbi:MAG: hydroxymethylglutaryl-CoA synthase family protein, partial [Deltaproteobacteria bacterium]|nr:hydroxymethylglutaryl-CoA synthase family protein [Deltaproteobacteria bacterium]